MGYTNADVAAAARQGQDRESSTGNFWTENTERRSYVGYTGYLPARLHQIMQERMAHISQIVYSYSTVIAWKDGNSWIIPDISYSPTTSTKHMSQLYVLPNTKYIPADAGIEEYMSVIEDKISYTRSGYSARLGTYRVLQAA